MGVFGTRHFQIGFSWVFLVSDICEYKKTQKNRKQISKISQYIVTPMGGAAVGVKTAIYQYREHPYHFVSSRRGLAD